MGNNCCANTNINQDTELIQIPSIIKVVTPKESSHIPEFIQDKISKQRSKEQSYPLREEDILQNQKEHMILYSNNKNNTPQSIQSNQLKVGPEIFVNLKKDSLTKHYILGNVLGEGAYGKVYQVKQISSEITRAMKSIKKSSLINEDKEKLFSEMYILKNLDHPNIVKLFELFQDEQCYYLITEFLSGGELFDRIKSFEHFSENDAAKFIKQILSAVVYCHQKNIVHRDLKPENIIFENKNPDSALKVIDFGTSRKFDPLKKMNKKLGTPYYIAPEVLKQDYDEKCDVWSCGVILYIFLCGYPPFGGHNEEEILKRVEKGKVFFDPEDWNKISLDAKTLIKRMLDYNPKSRISAEAALNHPWVQKNTEKNYVDSKCLKNLQKFNARSKFKQTILTFIASQMVSNQEQEELKKAFHTIDLNGDGVLTKEELISGYKSVTGDQFLAEQIVEKVMKNIDMNHSGEVDFTEFLVAAMNEEKTLTRGKIEQTFRILDLDGDGFISKDEIEYIMGDIELEIWNEFLKDCDQDNDGKVYELQQDISLRICRLALRKDRKYLILN